VKDDDVVCLIPARAGSTRVPGKNVAVVGGRSLLERAVTTALEAFGSVVVSTDSEDYAAIARAAGARVPGLRPADLATERAPMDGVVVHAVRTWAPPGATIVVVAQPSSPFTEADDLRAVVRALRDTPGARSSLTAVRVPAQSGFLLIEDEPGLARAAAPLLSALRTQELPPLWLPSGNAFATWTERVAAGGPFVAEPIALAPVPERRALEIDDPSDMARARQLAGEQ